MATIKDVAALAGVGIGTASRALSGKGSVSPATLARVQQAIEQLDFRPSRAARALMSGSSQMIGVSAPGTTDMCYTPVLQAIHATLHQAGLNMVLAFGASDGAMQAKPDGGLTFPAGHGCDGLLVLSGPEDNLNIDALRHHQVPLVMVNRALADLPGQCFTTGHARGGQLAAQALLRHGHQQFAIIGGPPHTADNNDWLRGVLAALGEAGIDTSTAWIAQSELTRAAGWDSAARLLASDHKHTALLCANDELAIGALALFHRMGVAVPEQVSVIGYNGSDSGAFTIPALTSVCVPMRETALAALNHLLNTCYGSDLPVQRRYEPSLVWRTSVARAPVKKPGKDRRSHAANGALVHTGCV